MRDRNRRPAPPTDVVKLDAVIFGGGIAGLWLLDELVRDGYQAALLEAGDLGMGQTVLSQGILHGGLKYSLKGLLTGSARAVRRMPAIWHDCLKGRRQPDLTETTVLSRHYLFWETRSLRSRWGARSASLLLSSRMAAIPGSARPAILEGCPGKVWRVDEWVIDAHSLLRNLAARHAGRLLRIAFPDGLEAQVREGSVGLLQLSSFGRYLRIEPRSVILTAGRGNTALRQLLGLAPGRSQERPLHMVMVRGDLPELYGHCIDGAKTRVTITTHRDSQDRRVWQLGGEIAERGCSLSSEELVSEARREIGEILPGIDLRNTQWATYRATRAEGRTPGGKRPAEVSLLQESNLITAWPTKLVLAPRLAEAVKGQLPGAQCPPPDDCCFEGWPRPVVATPPWEEQADWG